jgi:co-chaperonin GroES (HSP10)
MEKTINDLQAIGEHIFIVKDEVQKDMGGFLRPETSVIKPNTGKILSVGSKIIDKNVKPERTAIFNASAGFAINIFDTEVTVLTYAQLLGVTT